MARSSLNTSSWIFYGVVLAIAAARYTSRLMLFRWDIRKFQLEDWIMLGALCVYTILLVTINIVADTNSNLLPPGFDINSLTKADIKQREYGSKLVLVVEQSQCVTVWAVKTCLLIMYYRLTIVLKENIAVKLLSAYVAFGFVFMEIFYFAVWCRPFHDYWAVPSSNVQCTAATNHLITNAVLNISSDFFLLILGLQMVIRSRLPLKRKLVLCIIFGIGTFSIIGSILNKYYSFTKPFGLEWTFWYVRESSTALMTANLPYTWPILRRVFHLKSFDGRGSGPSVLESATRRLSQYSSRLRKTSWEPSPVVDHPLKRYTTSPTPNTKKSMFRRHSEIGPLGTNFARNPQDISFGASTLGSSNSSATRSDNGLKNWRDNDVFGRQDQEVHKTMTMGIDQWDFANRASLEEDDEEKHSPGDAVMRKDQNKDLEHGPDAQRCDTIVEIEPAALPLERWTEEDEEAAAGLPPLLPRESAELEAPPRVLSSSSSSSSQRSPRTLTPRAETPPPSQIP